MRITKLGLRKSCCWCALDISFRYPVFIFFFLSLTKLSPLPGSLFLQNHVMNHPETNFSLSCQTAHVPVSSSPGAGTSLLTRRQQNATYLHQLELPSLPPLSQLLTEPNGNVAAANSRLIPSSKPTTAVMPSTEETTAAAAAAAMMHHQTTAQASVYFGDYSLGNISNTAMIPQTAAAAAAAAIPSSEATVTTTALSLAAQTSTAPATSSAELFVSNSAMMDQPFSSISLDTTGVYSSLAGPSAPGISTNDPNMAAAAAAAAAAAMAAVSATNETAIKSEEERRKRHASESSTSSADKVYSFVAIPGTNQKKRPRRRYDEIERLYHCNWPGCTKSYGTLNHLNAHVSMQKHVSIIDNFFFLI